MNDNNYFLKFEDRIPPPPLPYSALRESIWQFLAIVAIVIGGWYIWWRWTGSLNHDAMWFAVPLAVAETCAFFGMILFVFNLWKDDPIKIVIPVHITGTVDHPKYSLEGQYVSAKLDEHIKKQGDELKEGWKKEMEETWGRNDTNQVDDLIDVQRDPADTNGGRARDVLDKVKKPFEKLKKPFKSIGDKFGK